ncbi:MAG: GrpB family protein [Bryobacteraceae bacterium]
MLVDDDPKWPQIFDREASRIRTALKSRALRIEHAGSTSVPGVVAKPVIDIILVVSNSADESAYLPAPESAGYTLRIREPNWYEHRMFKGPDTDVNLNLHVFSLSCPEVERMLLFRDWLRGNPADRDLYARTKSALAQQEWEHVQNYADAKTAVIEEILTRARS